MPCGATQDGRVIVERSDRMCSTGEGNGTPFQYSCLENPMNSMKRQNDRIPKEELYRLVSTQYATGDQWRNNSRKNEGMELKKKQHPVLDVTGDRSQVWCCKEQYCIRSDQIRSVAQSCPTLSKFAGILSAAFSQHHLSGFGIAQLEFHHLH